MSSNADRVLFMVMLFYDACRCLPASCVHYPTIPDTFMPCALYLASIKLLNAGFFDPLANSLFYVLLLKENCSKQIQTVKGVRIIIKANNMNSAAISISNLKSDVFFALYFLRKYKRFRFEYRLLLFASIYKAGGFFQKFD